MKQISKGNIVIRRVGMVNKLIRDERVASRVCKGQTMLDNGRRNILPNNALGMLLATTRDRSYVNTRSTGIHLLLVDTASFESSSMIAITIRTTEISFRLCQTMFRIGPVI
ncbi:hypothetical protein ACLKA7_007609 [Drosophila subpalustris]